MKNKVEMKYVAGNENSFNDNGCWELTVSHKVLGKMSTCIAEKDALIVALAIGVARDAGIKEGQKHQGV